MPKLTGPLLSISARGTFANAITFTQTNGRPVARKHARPQLTRTDAQNAARVLHAYLTSRWQTLSDEQRTTWNTLAALDRQSGYNRFLSFNLLRWQTLKPPADAPTVPTGSASLYEDAADYTGGIRKVTIHDTNEGGPHASAQLILILRSAAAITTPSKTMLTAIQPGPFNEEFSYELTQQAAGTWHFRFAYARFDGRIGTWSYDGSATVT